MKVRVSACLPVICTVLAFAVQLKATPLQQIQQELQGIIFREFCNAYFKEHAYIQCTDSEIWVNEVFY